ncbi:hypothetical protein BB558_000476 [Smittium angustum]|uniref:DUF2470 domain-containing protein n=1 Tax=Smittium angustum TaxID=133377 RepID=A0A2U1JE49_SMIAN|nr:hypothetical protein BB558_000476 [Smittium angustum]
MSWLYFQKDEFKIGWSFLLMNRVNIKNQESERVLVLKNLQEELNKNHKHSLDLLARHFGERKDAANARLSDIDDGGFTLRWESGEKKEAEDMSFAFRSKKNTNADIMREISDLVGQARKALNEKEESDLEKTYKTKRALAFELDNKSAVITAVLLGLGAYASLYGNPLPFGFLDLIFSQSMSTKILKLTAIVHAFETVVAFGVCRVARAAFPEEMTDRDERLWLINTFIFGVSSSIPLVKKTFKAFGGRD